MQTHCCKNCGAELQHWEVLEKTDTGRETVWTRCPKCYWSIKYLRVLKPKEYWLLAACNPDAYTRRMEKKNETRNNKK